MIRRTSEQTMRLEAALADSHVFVRRVAISTLCN